MTTGSLIELADEVWRLREKLPQWVIYDHPRDFPDSFVARLWTCLPEPEATDKVIVAQDINELRDIIAGFGMVRLPRAGGDDPSIVEVWT